MTGIMFDWAEHPSKPLTEVEVLAGFVLNKSGVQSNRQRDRSTKLKDEFERIGAWITRQMCQPEPTDGYVGELGALELCLACLKIACAKKPRPAQSWYRNASVNIQSFRVVAASALMRELNTVARGARAAQADSGGFVGVNGGAASGFGRHQPAYVLGFTGYERDETIASGSSGRRTMGVYTPTSEEAQQATRVDPVTQQLQTLIDSRYPRN